MKRWLVPFIVVATAAPVAGQTLYLPAAANVEGVNQTRWRTDVQVKAQGGTGASFTVELLETGANNSQPIALDFTVGVGQSLRLGNLLETGFGFEGTAALRLTATAGRIAATSRTYNDAPAGTYGQTVPAVTDDDAISYGEDATLILLSRSPDPAAGFRTNLGLVNLTEGPIAIEADLFAADGAPLGTVTRSLRPFEHRQLNDIFHLAGADDVPDGYVVARTTSDGGRLLAYASVVDNGTGDAVFLLARPDGADEVPPAPRLVVFESFLRFGCPVCDSAGVVLRQLKTDYAADNVLIVEHDVDATLAGRLDLWFGAYGLPGTVYLPLVMIDSGHRISSGEVDFEAVYSDMIDDALQRPTGADMAVDTERSGTLLRFDVRLVNRSGRTLSADNEATLTALIWREPTDPTALPFVAAGGTAAITNLADGDVTEITFEVSAGSLDPNLTRWVVIAHYRPGTDATHDTLQAVAGP